MAEVFLAKSTGAEGIEKVLVVKRVLPTFARSAKFIAMFLEEAKIATRLNHPNIVQVYAFEQVRDEFLLAMEYVDGLDLGRLISAARRRETRIPYGLACFIVMEVAKGLDYAHKRRDERGEPMEIVHRDVSPQNVLLSYEGAVKAADFGIAKARLVSEETGIIKGKFSYMSPEQARGERVDRRSDVYALGVLLAELLMNRAMYPGQHGLDVLEQVRQGRLTLPEQADPTVPDELCALVRRACAFDREERYQTARSLAGALSQYLHLLDDVWDHEALERFIQDIAPRETTSPDAGRSNEPGEQTAATVASAVVAERELRERRHVVVVAGRVSGGEGTPEGSDPGARSAGVGDEAARVLADIAYKSDAVLSWPDGAGRSRFRFILGLRRASVHDPLSAMRLSLDVIEALNGLSADMLVPLNASLGVSRGVVSTVRDGGGRLLRYEPVGAVVDVAERLADEGAPGEILTAGEIYRLVRRVFAFDDEQRAVEVTTSVGRGSRGLRAYRLRGARTREERAAEALATPGAQRIVGREEELRAFAESWEETLATRRSVFLAVSGELGVGKTFLAAAAIDALEPTPRVLHAECAFGTQDVPFAMVTELVRAACGIAEDCPADEAREKLRATIVDLLPSHDERDELVEGLAPLVAPVARDAEAPVEDRTPLVGRAARVLVGALAARGPTVIWIDALQWADAPSLELMATMLRKAYEVPLMVVLSTRPDARTERVLSAVPHIELEELDHDARRALIRARFDGASVPPDVEKAIVDRAGGNPFFITELVEALVERKVVSIESSGEGERRVVRKPGVAIQLPTTLEGVIAARLDELPEEERRAVRWLAAVGPGHDARELSTIAGTDLADHLASLEERGLVHHVQGDAYGFPSAVIRAVAYETTDEEDRVRMHRRIGSYLSRLDVPVPPARIARHLERAGERGPAADAYLRAASAARAVYSNREALRFYARALALLPADSPNRFWAHEAREQILRGMGRPHEQRLELEAMRAFAEASTDPSMLALAMNRLARLELDQVRTQGVDEILERALDAARRSGEAGAEVEALRLSAQLAREQGDMARALDFCDQALSRADFDRSLLAARGSVMVQRAILLRRMGRLDEALQANAEAIVIFRRLGIKRNEALALNALGVALASMGDFEDAATLIRASIAIDRETGDRMHLGRKLSNVGQLYAELGDNDRALAFLERSLVVFETVDDEGGRADALSAMAEILLEHAGNQDAAAERLDNARRLAERTGDRYDLARERIVRVALESAAGRLDRAEQYAREAVDVAEAAGIVGYALLGKAYLGELLARVGRADEARGVVFEVREGVRSRGVVERAERVHLAIARAYALLGEEEAARAAYADAYEVVESRLAHIREPALRARYVATPTVKAIRSPG